MRKQFKVSDPKPDALAVRSEDEKELDALLETVCTVTGTKEQGVADQVVAQVATFYPSLQTTERRLINAIHAMGEMAPQNLTESMLAGQMLSVNTAAQQFLERSLAPNQPVEFIDRNVLRVVRLMRLFNEQVDTLQRLRGKAGQQRVVVEHVNVHEGGQAIVGAVGVGVKSNGQ